MDRLITDTPDRWVIVKISNEYYKVFGSWVGGYLSGDYWKLNSGIKDADQDQDYYYFEGYSGSCYKCRKDSYGINTSYVSSVLDNIIETAKGEVELMEDCEDWTVAVNGC